MLTSIKLDNFKCYENETYFPINKITLLTGVNGYGKSSLIQSLLLLRQSFLYDVDGRELIISGNSIRLGTFQDLKNRNNSNNRPINIGIEWNNENYTTNYFFLSEEDIVFPTASLKKVNVSCIDSNLIKWRYSSEFPFSEFQIEDSENNKSVVSNIENNLLDWFIPFKMFNYIMSSDVLTSEFHPYAQIRDLHYIAADRIGPKQQYDATSEFSDIRVSPNGSNAIHILYAHSRHKKVNKAISKSESQNIIEELNLRLNDILGNSKLAIFYNEGGGYNITFDKFKPINVGFGFSYILPIIVSCLIANENEIILIENPEAHLHPKAQHNLAIFLAEVAKKLNVQIVIETHSEHILNGFRVASQTQIEDNNLINYSDINILYFNGNSEYYYDFITLNENGTIDNWPNDFFDQTSKDFKTIYK